MARVLGIIGGGQLGMMIAEAAGNMQDHVSKIIVLDPTPGCPASQAGAEQIVADFKDRDAIVALAKKSDVVTYEIESGDSDVLKSVEGDVKINPSPDTLRIIQDKLLQKSFLAENGIPVPEFVRVDGLGDLRDGLDAFDYPALLKARRDAYDGRGNFKIDFPSQAEAAFEHLGKKGLMLERFVPFRMEVSVIAARSTDGEIVTYPLVENIHEHNILRETIAPARVPEQVARRAEKIARDVMRVLKGAGVFGIEMFLTRDDDVIINEIAPRVHNSGHHTLQSSKTSQFEQHLRAILGLGLGDASLIRPTVMYNILGSESFEGRYQPISVSGPGTHLKMYGKEFSRPLRKLGHVNLVAQDGETLDHLLGRLSEISRKLETRPAP